MAESPEPYRELTQLIEEMIREVRTMRSELVALWEEMGDLREESRAQARALLAGLDRLGRG